MTAQVSEGGFPGGAGCWESGLAKGQRCLQDQPLPGQGAAIARPRMMQAC